MLNTPLVVSDGENKNKISHHQDTKGTKEHKEKQDVNFVFLGALGVLVVNTLQSTPQ